jgi:hypothetical protein
LIDEEKKEELKSMGIHYLKSGAMISVYARPLFRQKGVQSCVSRANCALEDCQGRETYGDDSSGVTRETDGAFLSTSEHHLQSIDARSSKL